MTDINEANNLKNSTPTASLVERLVIPLINCKVCDRSPSSYSCGSQYRGCSVTIWAVECDHSEEDEPLPFMEHRLTVYGKDRQEAESRWNEFNRV